MKGQLERMLAMRRYREVLDLLNNIVWEDPGLAEIAGIVGEALLTGDGAMQNFEAAFPLLRRAGEAGDKRALIALSRAYDNGLGVTQDHDEAFRYLRLAADTGSLDAIQWTAQRYDRAKDFAASAIWWRKLADRRWGSYAQTQLGAMFRDGRGVDRDLVTAYMWFNIASDPDPLQPTGDSEAKKLRDAVAMELTHEQLIEGQRRSWDWRPAEPVEISTGETLP